MTRDGGFDDFLDAVEDGEPYYLERADGTAMLPPPERSTGETRPERHPLPETGELLTHTTTAVATPSFGDDAPYVTAVASFGPVSLTGQVREIEPEDIEIGLEVEPGVERTETDGRRVLVFYPR